MKTIVHSLVAGVLCLGGWTSGAAPAPVEWHAEGLREGALVEVLPQKALAHFQVDRLSELVEALEALVRETVPERWAPPDLQQLLQMEHPVLAALGLRASGEPFGPGDIEKKFGLSMDEPISLTVYPGLPPKSFLLSLPVSDLEVFQGFLQQALHGVAMEQATVGGKKYIEIHLKRPPFETLALAAREDRVFISGDPALLMLLYRDNSFPRLADEEFSSQVFEENSDNEIWLSVHSALLEPLWPTVEFFQYAPLTWALEKRDELLERIPPPQRQAIEQRFRIQYGIRDLDQLADYLECVLTASYEELLDLFLTQAKAFNGVSLGWNLDGALLEGSASFYSDRIPGERRTQPIPLDEVRETLASMPGPANHFSVAGRTAAPSPSERISSWLDRLREALEARGLRTEFVDAMRRVHLESTLPAPISSEVPWTLETWTPVNPMPEVGTYDQLTEWGRDALSYLVKPAVRRVTVVPATGGVLENALTRRQRALTRNRELAEESFWPDQERFRLVDWIYRVHSNDLPGGVDQVTWETAWVTRGGVFGFNEHELINRRIYYTREIGERTVFHQASRDAEWISNLEMGEGAGVSPGVELLLDRVPEGATFFCVHRWLPNVPRAMEWVEEFEDLIHRDAAEILHEARERLDSDDAEDLSARLSDLKFSPVVYSVNRNPDTGEIYALLPGGFVFPRPKIAPNVTRLFEDFDEEAADQSGILIYTRESDGVAKASATVNRAAFSALLRTVGNAAHREFLANPEGMQRLRSDLLVEGDREPSRRDEILARNPFWEALPLPGSGPPAPEPSQPKVEAAPQGEIPERSEDASDALIDLSDHYNAALTDSWHSGGLPDNTLSNLPRGLQSFAGTKFDARGILQLTGQDAEAQLNVQFPSEETGIEINRKARRLHFLHGTGWAAAEGTVVAKYRIRYSDGDSRDFDVVYGKHVRDWWTQPGQDGVSESTVAWSGENGATEGSPATLQLYKSTWENPLPERTIASLDFISTRSTSAPFLIAVTAE